MSPASIWILALIFYCSPVQGSMAGASTSIYEFDNMVRGQHIYKSVKDFTYYLTGVVKLISASRCSKTMNVMNML